MAKIKTAFLSFEQFHGRKNIGSSRIRANWLVEKWKEAGADLGEAELYRYGGKYDVIIFQKVYWTEMAQAFKGIKILDMCDPDFLTWGYPVKEMIDACDAITTSSENLAVALHSIAGGKPIWYIPDRVLDPEKIEQKVHTGPTKSIAWYGYADNFPMLDSAINSVIKADLELLVVATKPYTPRSVMATGKLRYRNLPWSPETWLKDVMKADLVLNPQGVGGKWKFKSNNKTTQAWAVGMPVVHNDAELKALMTEEQRITEATKRRAEVLADYDVRKSVEEMKKLILEINATKATA